MKSMIVRCTAWRHLWSLLVLISVGGLTHAVIASCGCQNLCTNAYCHGYDSIGNGLSCNSYSPQYGTFEWNWTGNNGYNTAVQTGNTCNVFSGGSCSILCSDIFGNGQCTGGSQADCVAGQMLMQVGQWLCTTSSNGS